MSRREFSASRQPASAEEDKRSLGRLDLRRSDGVVAELEWHGERLKVDVYDISPYGMCFKCESQVANHLQEGDVIRLFVRFPSSESYIFVTTVCWKSHFKENIFRLGLRINSQHLQSGTDQKANGVKQVRARDLDFKFIEIPEKYPIMGGVYKPNLFYERATIRLERISKAFLEFIIFDSEIILFSGMNLTLLLDLGGGLEGEVRVIVERAHAAKGKNVFVKAKILDFPKNLMERISEKLVWNCEFSPDQLREAGLAIGPLSNGFRFRYVRNEEEYYKVLELRKSAYELAGKVSANKKIEEMAAPLDHLSRILVAFHGEKLVASVAIAFPDRDDLLLDTERTFAGGYPEPIPRKTKLIEISRLCTDPDYRRSDLVFRMFEYIVKTLHCGNRQYFLTSTDSNLWPLYKRIGFKKTGMKYAHPYLNGLQHHVLLASRITSDTGWGMNPFVWNMLYKDMILHLKKSEPAKISPWQSIFRRASIVLGRLFLLPKRKKT